MKWNFDFTKLSLAALKELRAGIDSAFSLIREYLLRKWTELGKFFDRRNEERERKKLEQDLLICDEMRNGAKEELDAEIGRRGNGGKQTNGESSASFDAVPPFELFGTTKDDEIESAVAKEFSGLSIEEIVRKEDVILAEYQKWLQSMNGNQPKREQYSSQEAYEIEETLWRQKHEEGARILKLARGNIDAIMAPLSVATDKEALFKIERLRERKFGVEYAEKITEEVKEHAETCNLYQRRLVEVPDMEKELEEKRNVYQNAKSNNESSQSLIQKFTEINKLERQLFSLKKSRDQAYDSMQQKRLDRENWRNQQIRDEAIELLQYVFPDKGGIPFYSLDYRRRVLEEARKDGFEAEATDGFDFYDIIAKHYNTGGRVFQEPTEFKHDNLQDGEGGACNSGLGIIKIKPMSRPSEPENIDILIRNCNQYRGAFVHEPGHDLETGNLGTDRTNLNSTKLGWEQGIDITTLKSDRDTVIPNKKKPNLCARVDNYSQTLHRQMSRVGRITGEALTYRQSEVISTALEYLALDPETFIRRCPWQFNLLLENLEELAKKTDAVHGGDTRQ